MLLVTVALMKATGVAERLDKASGFRAASSMVITMTQSLHVPGPEAESHVRQLWVNRDRQAPASHSFNALIFPKP